MQTLIHYFLHLIFPLAIAYIFFHKDWRKAYVILLLTMFVDLDHLLANPIFQVDRCSIAFHPLHSYYAILVYVLLLIPKGTIRIIGIGLLMHMLTDLVDCFLMFNSCHACFEEAPAYDLLSWISRLLEH